MKKNVKEMKMEKVTEEVMEETMEETMEEPDEKDELFEKAEMLFEDIEEFGNSGGMVFDDMMLGLYGLMYEQQIYANEGPLYGLIVATLRVLGLNKRCYRNNCNEIVADFDDFVIVVNDTFDVGVIKAKVYRLIK